MKQQNVNSSKHEKENWFQIGDIVLTRDTKKLWKSEPKFLPEAFKIVDNTVGNKFTQQNWSNTLIRHPNDLKRFHGLTYFLT